MEDENGISYTEYANEQLFIEHCSMKIKFFIIISSAVRCKTKFHLIVWQLFVGLFIVLCTWKFIAPAKDIAAYL